MEGWIKLHRKSLDHWLYNENRPHTKREAWEDILIMCNHEDNKFMINGELIHCNSGQSVMSLKSWSKQFKWSIQSTRTFFNILEKDKMIVVEGLKYSTRITVCNYDIYQKQQQTDNKLITNCQQTDNILLTTNKKNKNDNNEKNVKKEELLSKIQEEFYDHLKTFISEYDKTVLREFYDYWSEPNKLKTKIRWQLEKTWDTKKRLERWVNNIGKKTKQQTWNEKTIPAI